MDGQVSKSLLYPAASENEDLKFQGNEWKCIISQTNDLPTPLQEVLL